MALRISLKRWWGYPHTSLGLCGLLIIKLEVFQIDLRGTDNFSPSFLNADCFTACSVSTNSKNIQVEFDSINSVQCSPLIFASS